MNESTVSAGPADAWTIQRVLAWAAKDLGAKGSESPRLDAELLLSMVLGCDRIKLILEASKPLSKEELGSYRELHKRRRVGEPIAHLRGVREFYGRDFVVDRRVLIPRPETETLVECVLRRTRHRSLSARILDVCTGSGCVAITLQKERPTTTVFGSDISTDALAVARENSLRIGLIGLIHADLFAGMDSLTGSLDAITANPPYINDEDFAEMSRDIREFEPRLALAAGQDALSITKTLVAQAPRMLAPGGLLAIETMAGCAPELARVMSSAGFTEIAVDKDYGGHERVVSGKSAQPI